VALPKPPRSPQPLRAGEGGRSTPWTQGDCMFRAGPWAEAPDSMVGHGFHRPQTPDSVIALPLNGIERHGLVARHA